MARAKMLARGIALGALMLGIGCAASGAAYAATNGCMSVIRWVGAY